VLAGYYGLYCVLRKAQRKNKRAEEPLTAVPTGRIKRRRRRKLVEGRCDEREILRFQVLLFLALSVLSLLAGAKGEKNALKLATALEGGTEAL